jgi:hypothetical protein
LLTCKDIDADPTIDRVAKDALEPSVPSLNGRDYISMRGIIFSEEEKRIGGGDFVL